MIIARVDFDFTPILQSTPRLLPCLDRIGTVNSEDRPEDDLADGWLMMTQVSSAWCAMCATISLRTLQTPTQPVPPCAAPTGETHAGQESLPRRPQGPEPGRGRRLGPISWVSRPPTGPLGVQAFDGGCRALWRGRLRRQTVGADVSG